MTFTHLLYFRKAVQYRSIHKAAKELFISPSGLSMALRSLEKELGYSLFVRSNAGLSLTPEGEDFFNDTEIILGFQKKWQEIGQQRLRPEQTVVKIAVIPSVFNAVFHKILSDYMTLDKPIYPIAMEQTCHEINNALLNRHVCYAITSYNEGADAGLRIMADNLDLDFIPLMKDTYNVYVGQASPLYNKSSCNQKELSQYVGVSMGHDSINQFDSQRFFNKNQTLFFHNQNTLLQKVVDSDYFALLPSLLKHHYFCQTGLLHALDFDEKITPIQYALVTPKIDQISTTEYPFIDHIQHYFQELS